MKSGQTMRDVRFAPASGANPEWGWPMSTRQVLHELVEDRRVTHGVGVVVHHRDQPLLIKARWQEHAAVYAVDPLCERQVEVGTLVVAVVAHRCRRPRYASFRPEPHRVGRNAGPINDRLTGVNEPSVAGIRVGMCVEGTCLRQRRLGGCHYKWVAVVGPEMHDLALCNQVHVFSPATKGPDRETAPDRLG